MYRVEIISNKSVETDILEALEEFVPNILYTQIPLAYGRGEDSRKMGTTTWPETNFVLISYINADQLPGVKAVVEAIKKKFPSEGIKMFVIESSEN